MGFGLLLIGYFITFLMSVHGYGFLFEIIGYTIMLYAVSKLSEYKHRILHVAFPLIGMALHSAYMGLSKVNDVLELHLPFFNNNVLLAFSLISAVSTVVFHVLLLLPIRDIAKDAEEKELVFGAYCALAVACIGCLIEPVTVIGSRAFVYAAETFATEGTSAVGIIGGADGPTTILVTQSLPPSFKIASFFIQLFYPLAPLIFFFFCYVRLCAPEDIDMPQKPSRFAFINRFREKQAEKEAETERARSQYQQGLEEKARKKRQGSRKKKKRK